MIMCDVKGHNDPTTWNKDMALQLKPLSQQVMVITGASSGIGLVTTRLAAREGAKLVLVSRNEESLSRLKAEIEETGGEVIIIAADVSREDEMRRVAREAIARFGRFDTWVNNAGVSIYGKIVEIPLEDQRKLFDTNFWGVVIGSSIAAQHLRGHGGAIINIGSVVSDRAMPLQGTYSASKHAVKGFTDSLRMELEQENLPVAVTLIKPAAIDTPYTEHARNYMETEPKFPPPVYAPELVAKAILYSATHPVRDVYVGGASRAISTLGKLMPRLVDKVMEQTLFDGQKKLDGRGNDHKDGLYSSSEHELRERGTGSNFTLERSLYTQASLHPFMSTAAIAGVIGATWLLRGRGRRILQNQGA
jgi:short-subunit dehydrogenase